MTESAPRRFSEQHPLQGDRARLEAITTKMWWAILKVFGQDPRPLPAPGQPPRGELTLVGGTSPVDVLQESLIALVRGKPDDGSSWEGYGVGIAKNKAKGALRDSRAWRKRPGNDDIAVLPLDATNDAGRRLIDELPSPLDVELTLQEGQDEFERLQRQEALHQAAHEVLSDRDRQIIFRISRGETREQIKGDFNISEQRVGQIYAKALNSLRDHLEHNPLFRPTTAPTQGGIPNGE
jgi:RNA polymerase sigma factor (sigma-70 family)